MMKTLALLALAVVMALPTGAAPARAEGPERVAPVGDPLVKKECGACHMAFQPGLLPAGSWRLVMKDLSNHFGDSATLPPDQVSAITGYLTAHAGSGDATLPRITDQGWWRHEHRRSEQDWSRPEIKSKANCGACHREADRGVYED